MSKVKKDNFEDFCRYGVRDAILCTAIPLDIHSRFSSIGLDFQARTAAFSEKFFKDFFEKYYKTYGKDWRRLLGQVEGYSDDKPYKHWIPGRVQRRCLEQWYHGARNEVHRVGCFGAAYYHDLTSAYPTALIMLIADYDFSRSRHHWGADAEREITKLRKLGPYQPHAVAVFCRFKSDAIPMFPVDVDGSKVFPQIFHGTVSWPEYWTAVDLDLLEESTVIELITFDTLKGRYLPEKIAELLKKRKENKLLYKNLLNYQYGKTVQGVSGTVPFSSISCPALGAYMTGFCRASVGELANLNKDYYALITDGFISPHEHLKTGAFNQPVTDRLKPIGYDWIEIDARGTESFFIKTRGYGLWDAKTGKGKIAAMGVQAHGDVTELARQIKAGKAIKRSFVGFCATDEDVKREQKRRAKAVRDKKPLIPRKLLPGETIIYRKEEFTLDTTFDFKFIPIPETIEDTGAEYNGTFLALISFDTRPVRDIYEYEHLRILARLKNDEKYEELKRRGLTSSQTFDIITAHALEQPQARRLMWFIRHELTTQVKRSETTLTAKQWAAFKRIKPYGFHLTPEELKSFRWLFRHECQCIKDKDRRREVQRQLFADLKSHIHHDHLIPKISKSALL